MLTPKKMNLMNKRNLLKKFVTLSSPELKKTLMMMMMNMMTILMIYDFFDNKVY